MHQICDCGRGEATKEIEVDGEKQVVCYKCFLQWKYSGTIYGLNPKDWKDLKKRQEKQQNYPISFE